MPVIGLSVVNRRTEVERFTKLRVSDYALKPVNPVDLDERIRRVLRKESSWRNDRDQRSSTARAPQVLIIDPDPNYRAFVRPLLEPDYEVIEAAGGPDGLTKFRALEIKPDAILIAEDIPLLGSTRVAEILDRLCEQSGIPVPPTILMSETFETPPEAAARFAGVVRRSFVPEHFNRGVEQWLTRKQSSFDRVRAIFGEQASVWLRSAARQTIGVLSGQDAMPADVAAVPQHVSVTGSVELHLEDGGCRLHALVGCSTEHATRFASGVLRRDASFEDGGSDVLGEFINTIGGRVKASLVEKGFAIKLGLPTVAIEEVRVAEREFDSAAWMRTHSGEDFFVAVRVIDEAPGASGARAPRPTAPDSADLGDVLF